MSWIFSASAICSTARPSTLSGGEKQRVAIGRALLADPQLLLMDEPLASLDEARKAEIFPYIERLRDEGGVPIVLVSHSVAEIARLATSVVVLSEGRVTASGPAAEILRHTNLFAQTGLTEAGALIEAQVLRHEDGFGLTVLQARAGTLTVPRLDACRRHEPARAPSRPRHHPVPEGARGPERPQRAAGTHFLDRGSRGGERGCRSSIAAATLSWPA